MFTTYMSESRIPKSLHFDMVIYDEAHHITSSYPRGLKMSATLNGFADVKYNYYDAIKDGAMTDYRVRLFDGTASKILKHQTIMYHFVLLAKATTSTQTIAVEARDIMGYVGSEENVVPIRR